MATRRRNRGTTARSAVRPISDEVDPATWKAVTRHVTRSFYDRQRAVAFRTKSTMAKGPDVIRHDKKSLDALLHALGASHTARLTPDLTTYYEALAIFGGAGGLKQKLRNLFPPDGVTTYEGVGWRLRNIDGRMFAAAVYDGGPAARAGILIGDEVVRVGGKAPQEIAPFRGRSGKPVEVLIRRSRTQREMPLRIVPERIEPGALFLSSMRDSVRFFKPGGRTVGSIRPWSYAGDVYHSLLIAELSHGRLKDVDALVLDLRGGWGGASPDHANLFSGHTPTVIFVDRDGAQRSLGYRWDRPLVLLVDETTRSGKELFAWILQRHHHVPVVGTTTAGAVLACRPYLLPDSSLLLLAVQDVLVDGVRLEGQGVTPDVRVPFEFPYAAGRDPQMETAVREAARRCTRG